MTTVSGVAYYGFRFYNPEMGRWLNRDPLGELGGLNLMLFTLNNPITFYDKYGLFTEPIFGIPSHIWDAFFGGIQDAYNGIPDLINEAKCNALQATLTLLEADLAARQAILVFLETIGAGEVSHPVIIRGIDVTSYLEILIMLTDPLTLIVQDTIEDLEGIITDVESALDDCCPEGTCCPTD